MPEQELATGSLSQRQQRAGMDCADVIQVVLAGWKAKELRSVSHRLEAEELIEGEFNDAGFHVLAQVCFGFGLRSGAMSGFSTSIFNAFAAD